jgi:hypothetical protein
MTRTGNNYDEETIRKAVMITAGTGTAGDPSTYEYVKASRILKDEHGLEISEANLRRWVREHPDYVSAVQIALSLKSEKNIYEIVELSSEIVLAGLKDLKRRMDDEGLHLTTTDLKQLAVINGVGIDKVKIISASRDAANKIPGQTEIVFEAGSAALFTDKDGNQHYDVNGDPIPQHPGQTDFGALAGEGES